MDTTILAGSGLGADALMLLVYVLIALLFSFLCSLAEASLLSVTPSYIAGLRAKAPRRAAALHRIKEERIDQSLAAILTVNTIAHTMGAIGAGSKATAVFGDAWFGVFSAVMTLLILFASEIVPKTLGALYWRELTGFTTFYVNLLIRTMYPLIFVSEKLTQVVSGGKKPDDFNREEFVAMADLGREHGQIDERESKIIRNLFLFKSLEASDIMTPRIVVGALEESMRVEQALSAPGRAAFSRLPVYRGDLDQTTGFVLRDDLLVALNQGRGEDLVGEFRRELTAVPETTTLSQLLETLLAQRQHIALVVGEYGEVKGLVTLEDVVETLLGNEILDEGDRIEDLRALARQLWARRARRMGIELKPGVSDGDGP